MKLIRIKANSIHAALADARREYGDEVILVESHPAIGSGQAEIVITIPDATASTPASSRRSSAVTSRTERSAEIRNAGATRTPQPLLAFDLQAIQSRHRSGTDAMLPAAAAAAAQLSSERNPLTNSYRIGAPTDSVPEFENLLKHASRSTTSDVHPQLSPSAPAPVQHPQQDSRKRLAPRLIDAAKGIASKFIGEVESDATIEEPLPHLATPSRPSGPSPTTTRTNDRSLVQSSSAKSNEQIESRLSVLEELLSGVTIAFANRWISHPLYKEMIENGFKPETTVSILSTLASRGVPANSPLDYLRAKVYDELRRRNKTIVGRARTGRHVFLGTAAAGKTNLILKAATEPNIAGAGPVLVLTTDSSPERESTEVYSNARIETFKVHSAQQLSFSADALASYETVIVDATSFSADSDQRKLQEETLLDKIAPIGRPLVHYVVDVRRNLDDIADEIAASSIAIDALALTNLDGLKKQGRLVEFILDQKLPVFFVAASRYSQRQGLDPFSPAELFAQALRLEDWPYSESELSDYFNAPTARSKRPQMEFGSKRMQPAGLAGANL